ncbi:MAG: archaetidylserine decarboxylase [Gammaproteobacteria bacterium]
MASAFVLLQHLLPKRLMSDAVGVLTRVRGGVLTRAAIRLFIRAFGVDMRDAAGTVADYPTFNDFFTRALAPGARPQPEDPLALVAAADGRVSEAGPIEAGTLLQAKGVSYRLGELFGGDTTLAARFDGGAFHTIYLAPYNYHRVHMPLAGAARCLRYVPGKLYSVNAATAAGLPRLFCLNERVAVAFEGERGWFALVMVGALNVGSIDLALPAGAAFHNRPRATVPANRSVDLDGAACARGDEFGRFNMGSTVILVTSPGLAELAPTPGVGEAVRVGQPIGRLTA